MLTELSSFEALQYGSKAYGLAQLVKVGALIPPTLCLEMERHDLSDLIKTYSLPGSLERWIKAQVSSEIVIRSSALIEDSLAESKAGLLASKRVALTSEAVVEGILEVAQSIPETKRTLLLQPFVKGELSGVLFSADPSRGRKGQPIFSFAPGACADVVSGHVEVTTLSLDTVLMEEGVEPIMVSRSILLRRVAFDLEALWDVPVDIEFTITPDESVVFLQARPIASLTKWRGREGVIPINESHLPSTVAAHSKIALRSRCAKAGVAISRGWIATETSWYALPETGKLPEGAFSVVLIVPEQIEGKTLRIFSDTPVDTVRTLLGRASDYWVRHAILKEIIESKMTGIATSAPGGAVVEVALGHFIPKGVVETALYQLKNGIWEAVRTPLQSWAFEIDRQTGAAIQTFVGAEAKLEEDTLTELRILIGRLNLELGEFLEFGVSLAGKPFVIDIQSVSVPFQVSPRNDVVSLGAAEGRIRVVDKLSQRSTDEHFIDAQIGRRADNEGGEPIIVAAWLPALELIGELVRLEDSGCRVVGMVFGVYSPLCHLSILIREWGLPAIIDRDIFTMEKIDGAWARIVATESAGLLYVRHESTR